MYRLLNPLGFVPFKMGRLRGGRKEHIWNTWIDTWHLNRLRERGPRLHIGLPSITVVPVGDFVATVLVRERR